MTTMPGLVNMRRSTAIKQPCDASPAPTHDAVSTVPIDEPDKPHYVFSSFFPNTDNAVLINSRTVEFAERLRCYKGLQ